MITRRRFLMRGATLAGGTMLASLLAACQSSQAPAPAAPKPTEAAKPAAPAATTAPAAAAKPTEAAAKPAAPAAAPAATTAPAAAAKPADAAAAGTPKKGGTLRVGYDQENKTLDPHLSLQFAERHLMYSIYDTLVGSDEKFQPQPSLAVSWSNPDPKTYVFKLRPNVKFHDGTDFDATVVKWNIDRVKDPNTKSAQAPQFAIISSVEVVDPTTVKVNLTEPYAPLLAILMDRPGFMVSPAAVQKFGADFGRNPVGTGPFKFVQWMQDQGITLERNPNYWNADKTYLDKIEFRVVTDGTVRVTMLRTGELDLIDRFDAKAVAQLKDVAELKVAEYEGGIWHGLQWQVDKPPFDNKLLRQAIAWGINREALGKIHWDGYGKPATSLITNPGWNDGLTTIGYDPAKAKQLLSQAGFANGFSETLTIRARPDDTRLGELVQAQLADIGVKVNLGTINPNEWTTATHDRTINWTTTSWTQRADPDGLVSLLFKTNGTANTTFYQSPEFEAKIKEAAGIYDSAQRKPLYKAIQQTLIDDAPYVYLWQPSVFFAMKKNVQGLIHVPDDVFRLGGVWLS